jgi:hypothetical protein
MDAKMSWLTEKEVQVTVEGRIFSSPSVNPSLKMTVKSWLNTQALLCSCPGWRMHLMWPELWWRLLTCFLLWHVTRAELSYRQLTFFHIKSRSFSVLTVCVDLLLPGLSRYTKGQQAMSCSWTRKIASLSSSVLFYQLKRPNAHQSMTTA